MPAKCHNKLMWLALAYFGDATQICYLNTSIATATVAGIFRAFVAFCRVTGMFSLPYILAGNTKGGSIIVPLTSCLTGLDKSVLLIKTKIVSCHIANFKPAKQEVNGTVILPPLVFPGLGHDKVLCFDTQFWIGFELFWMVCGHFLSPFPPSDGMIFRL